MKSNFSDFENAFYNDGYTLSKKIIKEGLTAKTLIELTKNIYSIIDELIALFLEHCNRQNNKIDCKKECSYCCNQCILISPHEFFYINDFLNKKFCDNEITEIRNRAEHKHDKTKLMKTKDFVNFKHTCPFLINNICIIYEARPMACRIYLSSNVKSCKDELKDPENINIFPNLYEFPLLAGHRLNEGLIHALHEYNYSLAEIKIEEAIILMLSKKFLLKYWLDKTPIFNKYKLSEKDSEYLNKFSH